LDYILRAEGPVTALNRNHVLSRVVIASLACGVLVACSALIDLNGLASSGAPDDAAAEGSQKSNGEGGAGDGGATSGEGGATSGDGGCTLGFCACEGDAHTVCDDFDEGDPTTRWKFASYGGATIGFVMDGSVSPPVSALSVGQTATASMNLEGIMMPTNPPTSTKGRAEMDVVVETADSASGNGGAHGTCPLRIDFGKSTIRFSFYSDQSGIEQLVGPATVNYVPLATAFPAGTRGRLGLWYDTTARTCGATWNGVELAPTCKLASQIPSESDQVIVSAGIDFERPPSSAWVIRMDNYTFDD
jgi:hypothetical protein